MLEAMKTYGFSLGPVQTVPQLDFVQVSLISETKASAQAFLSVFFLQEELFYCQALLFQQSVPGCALEGCFCLLESNQMQQVQRAEGDSVVDRITA